MSGHVIDFALHEFILIFTAGHCIPAVARVNHLCIDAWLKLLRITCLGLATQATDFEIAFSKKEFHFIFTFTMASSATAGFLIGGGNSHRGHGFAFGHPQFQLPSRTAPVRATVTQRAASLGRRHGSAELGSSPGNARERESRRRDRSTSASNIISDPIQQATAYRLSPSGPQEAESVQVAYETLVNRVLTVETSLRKHAQLIGSQSELVAEEFQKHSQLIAKNTERCNWLHDHIENTAKDVKKVTDEHNNKLNIHGLQGGKWYRHLRRFMKHLRI